MMKKEQQNDLLQRVIRFFKEHFNPKLKCERLGHEVFEKSIKVRKKSYEFREVAADFKATQKVCKRCGTIIDTEIGEKIDWYTSCSMPQSMWDEIRENGFCVL